nr:hypothetical protein [Tanacetum cinerariifolium]
MALYHALIKSILADKDAMDKGVADIQKKRKPDDVDRDEDPLARPDQWLKRRKTGKDTKQSKKAKSSRTCKGTTKSQLKSTGKSAQAEETLFEAGDTQVPQDLGEDMGNTNEPLVVKADPKDRFKKPKRPPTPDPDAFAMNRLQISDLTQDILIVLVNCFFKNDLAYLPGGSTDRTYTTSLTKTEAAKYDLQGIEDMLLEKLNISRPLTHKAGITYLETYTTYSNPQVVIYLDKLERNRLMCSHELYKFSDGTLISVQDKLKDMLNNLEMGYTSVMPRRRWNNLDKKRSRITVKDIDRQLLEIRLMISLEKFVGGREYREDFRLLQRTI